MEFLIPIILVPMESNRSTFTVSVNLCHRMLEEKWRGYIRNNTIGNFMVSNSRKNETFFGCCVTYRKQRSTKTRNTFKHYNFSYFLI